jgi:glycosyltransferase involved in cell wall biosynthesis
LRIGLDGRASKWYRGTGIGNYAYQLISNLAKEDKHNDYIIFMPEDSDLEFKSVRNFNIKNISSNKSDNFWDEINIPNILGDCDVDIYHVPQNGIGLPKDKVCPFVITLHDVIPLKMPETVGENYLRIFNKEIPEIIQKCDGIITVSNYSKKDIAETLSFPEDKIYVTYLSNEKMYKRENKEFSKIIIRNHYGIEEDYILYVGGFSPRKNILGLIRAYAYLVNKYNIKEKLVIAGKKGKSYDMYKDETIKCKVEDKVIFPGFIELNHMPYLYSASELFVYPSFYEGFGLPPIEAMACMVPVITSNVTSMPEIVEDAAILVDPYDTDNIAEQMRRVLCDDSLKKKLILKGLNRVSRLSFKKTAAETIKIYEKISADSFF